MLKICNLPNIEILRYVLGKVVLINDTRAAENIVDKKEV